MRRKKSFFVYSALLVTTMIFWSINSVSAAATIYGPRKFIRLTGKPVIVTEIFSASSATTYNLVVLNGDMGKNRVSSATVKINGIEILKESDFNQQVDRIERRVSLLLSNSISVELKSAPGSLMTVSILSKTMNHAPVADAGPDQTVYVGDRVYLDGSKSTDVDGDPLTYLWQMISLPAGSAASLSNPSDVKPFFILDVHGTYVVQLIVNDGQADSLSDTVTITTLNSKPVADAGPDQTVYVGDMVQMDGSKSSDVDGDPLSFRWSFASTPPGSIATLSDTGAINPTFKVDLPGIYVVQLIVNDGTADSAPKTVPITTANSRPVANAGLDQTAYVNDIVQLDGSASSDADKDPLSFFWSIISKPDQSASTLDSSSKINPTFVPDLSGLYVAQLIVNDGTVDSFPDTTTITANLRMVTVPSVVNMIQEAAQAVIIGVKLTIGAITQDNSSTIPAGSVISQYPAAGTAVAEGSSVSLVISAGPVMVSVPNVIGMPQEVAESVITIAGLTVGAITAANSTTVPAGQVISQNPDPETSVPQGSPVSIVVSMGPVMVAVPNVVGMVQASAEAAIRAANLVVGTITTVNSNTIPTGSVVSQSPASGTSVAQGSLVNLVVSLGSNVQPQPEGSFGEKYQDLIPPDATVQSYDSKRFSVVTGLVKNLGSLPIGDVSVNILGYPGYGTAKTDPEGRFSIPVEGGGTITVTYRKDGLITTHRKVYVPWNDIAIAETITMIPEATRSTTMTFDGNSNTIVSHRSTVVTDDRGSRSSTAVFTGDNRAFSVDASGNVIQELTTIAIRATEFTTENSMPAKLPPTSAYTYCVELSVDGAQRVRFNKPVVLWVDNFLGFAVGQRVPVGYYDRDKGVWVPSDNGVVVRLLDTNGDGIVDALDANGDGQPDDLNNNGSFADEVIGLGDPQRYPPGSTFWRVQINHFTPWDCNWPYGPPADAVAPNPKGVPSADQQKKEEDDCRKSTSSFVEERSRIFHEDIPIPGTDMTLHYTSSRVKGFKQVITVPVSGETVPASLKRIIVQVDVAGRSFEKILSPLPNQMEEFVWDGLDHLGKEVNGPISAHVSVGFVYDGVYYGAGNSVRAFGQAGDVVTAIPARQEVIIWRWVDIKIMGSTKGVVADGWTISKHHYLNPIDPLTLYKGDGTTTKNNMNIVTTIVGSGPSGYLSYPREVTVDALGNLYIADYGHSAVRKLDRNGAITTVAWPDKPYGVAVDASGNLYISENLNCRILKVDRNRVMTVIAGNGTQGYGGDDGPAIEAKLNVPSGLTIDASGNLYIVDTANHRIRKVDPNGIITTVAGNGTGGYGGDGGPATQARLYYPYGAAVDLLGNLYIADMSNHRIRKVNPNGIITTIAGNGLYGYAGDGGPAIEAKLYEPNGVVLDGAGNLYIADAWNQRIRRVDTSGIINTVAGSGPIGGSQGGYSGDGGPATEARFNLPIGVTVDAAGNLYISDSSNCRIRKAAPPSVFIAVMTTGDIPFSEKNGLGHILSGAGSHKTTIDLDIGRILYAFGYDEDNNLISITDRFGNKTTIQRNSGGGPTAIISPDGVTTSLTIDSNNHLTRITYPDGGAYNFEYTADGLMTAKLEPEGNRFDHAFDANGRLTDGSDQEGGHWNYSRVAHESGDILTQVTTAEGNLTSYLDHTDSTAAYTSHITDPAGAETIFTRTSDGLTATKSLPCGMNLTFKYDLDSQYKFDFVKEMRERTASALEKVTLREKLYQDTNSDKIPDLITEKVTLNGKITTLVNNILQSKRTMTSPVGRTTTTFYDSNNLLTTKLTIPGLYDTNFGYDAKGRMTSINTDIRQTTLAYDAKGNLSSITDPESQTTTYSYDAVGRITGILRPDGSSVGFAYDKNGNMTVLANPSSVDHRFGYNKVNLNSSYQTPLSGSYSYLYNKDRRLTQINFPSGKQIKNIYDKDRLIQTQTPEGNINLSYLCGSKVGSIAKGTELISYGYDGSLVISETLSGALNQTLNYAYNNDFNVRQFTYAGSSVNYTYDSDGLLTGAGVFTITRNAGNGLPEAVTGGTLNINRIFNGYGELESLDFSVNALSLTSWGLNRDKTGRIVSKIETVQGLGSNSVYTYDSMGRLLTVTKDGALVEEYQYDSVGRRTYEMNALRGISGRTYAYSNEDHLITAGDTTYQYDADGFLTTKTQGSNVTRYNYSSRGELLAVILPDGRVMEYVNDPLGRRIAKKVNGVIIEKYLWQGLTKLLAVYDDSNNLVMRFEYADARIPVAMTKGGITYYLTYDQVGSLRIVADASANVVKRIDYDSFGNIISDTNPGFQVPFGFAGGLHDRDTGFVRFGFRDYDPDIGRWTAKDPIFFGGRGVNLYGYVADNPVRYVDSSGLQTLVTDISERTTTFDPRPLEPNGEPITIETRVDLTSDSLPGAGDAFTTPNVTVIDNINNPAYGPPGAYIDTGDPRGRDIHGGGTVLPDPYAPRQGWVRTRGCTRGQNEDVQRLGDEIRRFQQRNPGVQIPYTRRD
jgi:RHS repeat-associated protein